MGLSNLLSTRLSNFLLLCILVSCFLSVAAVCFGFVSEFCIFISLSLHYV